MGRTLLFFCFLFLFSMLVSNVLIAQDTIYKTDGTRFVAKVLVVGDTITCKRFDNQDGPTYLFQRSTIREIRYPNGRKDVFDPVVPSSVAPVTYTLPPINNAGHPITNRGGRFEQNRHHLSEKGMLEVASRRTSDPILMHEIELTKSFRRSQHFAGAVGALAVVGLASYLITSATYGGVFDQKIFLLPAGAVLAEATALVLKAQRKKHALKVMYQYNMHE